MHRVTDVSVWAGREAGLSAPSGLAYDSYERILYIVDAQNRRLVCLDPAERRLVPITGLPAWQKPLAIACAAGRLAVTDVGANALWVEGGQGWIQAVTADRLSPPLSLPGSVAGDQEGNLYFTDFHHNRIVCLRREGNLVILPEIVCTKPYGLCVWQHWLYVTDTAHGRILGAHLPQRSCRAVAGDGLPGFAPIAVAAGPSGDVYISTTRKIFHYSRHNAQLELLLDTAIWQRFRTEKLCHIGALAVVPGYGLVFTDTLQNQVYCVTMTAGADG